MSRITSALGSICWERRDLTFCSAHTHARTHTRLFTVFLIVPDKSWQMKKKERKKKQMLNDVFLCFIQNLLHVLMPEVKVGSEERF